MYNNISIFFRELKGNIGQVDESKGREDLMSNLSVPDGKSKTQVVQKKDEDFREKSNSLNDSFLKLKINTMQHPSNGQSNFVFIVDLFYFIEKYKTFVTKSFCFTIR